jgi:hypothetical protein
MRAHGRHSAFCGTCAISYGTIVTLLLILIARGLGAIGPSLQQDLGFWAMTAAIAFAAVSLLARALRRRSADRRVDPAPYG